MPESSPQKPVAAMLMTVHIAAAGVDDEEIDRMTRQLRSELEEAGIGSATFAPGVAPAGAKVIDPITIGALLLNVVPAAIPAVTNLLQSWMGRDAGRTVKVSVKVGDRSVDVEYSPHQMSGADVNALVASLTGSLEGKTT